MLFESLNTEQSNTLTTQLPPNTDNQEDISNNTQEEMVDPSVSEINLLSKIELLNNILIFNEHIKKSGIKVSDLETLLYFYPFLKYETCLVLFNKILDNLNQTSKK